MAPSENTVLMQTTLPSGRKEIPRKRGKHFMENGGEAGIRTLGAREGSTVFETAAFDHSATSPHGKYRAQRSGPR